MSNSCASLREFSIPASRSGRASLRWAAWVFPLLLVGCVNTMPVSPPASGTIVGGSQGTVVDPSLGGFFASAPAGAVTTLASGPWGAGAAVTVGPSYGAASQRVCRHLEVRRGATGARQHAVACDAGAGWVTRRLVTGVYNGEGALK